jgi:subtilisin family serine protease
VLALVLVVNARAATLTSPSTFDSLHNFVVVTFANEPYRTAPHAGTTGAHYSGDSYSVSQNAYYRARRLATVYSLRQVASWPIKALSVHCVVFEIPDDRSVSSVLAALARDPRVALAQPLQKFHTLTQTQTQTRTQTQAQAQSSTAAPAYNDPLYSLQTNLVSLGIQAAHERSQGAGVRIALIDTGVDSKHPDLHGRIAHTQSFIASRTTTTSAYRHGTAMAGLIAAVANNQVGIVGIAPQAQIDVFEACWQLKPDTDDAACNTFTLAQALAAAIATHAPLINLSIAGPPDPLLAALVQNGLKHGVIFVGSAAETADAFPTNIEGVIGVGNSDRAGGGTLTAPATHILTLRPHGQYDFESGTSVAAAEMTGVIALLLSANNHLTAPTIVSLLRDTSASRSAAVTAPTMDVNAALAKLEAETAGRRVASQTTH